MRNNSTRRKWYETNDGTLEEDWTRCVAENDDVTAETTDDELEDVADTWWDIALEAGDVLDWKYFLICLRGLRDHLQSIQS